MFSPPACFVAILMDNTPRYFEVAWAAQRSGLHYTAINSHLRPAEVQYVLDDCNATAHPGFGWKAILVLGSLGLLLYAAFTRERGPGFVGLLSTLITILVVAGTSPNPSIVGWPLILLLGAAAAFGIGLAPGGRSPGAAPRTPPPGPPPTATTEPPPPTL